MKRNKGYYIFALLIVLLLTVSINRKSTAQTLLVNEGKAASYIILETDNNKEVLSAAKDLQSYINKITGVEIPLLVGNIQQNGTAIRISSRSLKLSSEKGGHPETYSIRINKDEIFLEGNSPSAATFAVYSFIEDALGVQWFAPGDLWEYIPDQIKTLKVESIEKEGKPVYSPRFWSGFNYGDTWQVWRERNKVAKSNTTMPWISFQNNIYRIFPPSKYGKNHPEYYPLVNGKRQIPLESETAWYPCIGNRDVQEITIQYINDYFKTHPTVQSFSLGMDDVFVMCECDKCKKMDGTEADLKNNQLSDRYFNFINIVAKEVKKKNPSKFIGTLIYLQTSNLPKTISKIEDNVFGYMTQDWGKWANTGIKEADIQQTREWKKIMKHISRYNYLGYFSVAPRYYPHQLSEALKIDNTEGIGGMYSEVYTFLPHNAPMIWSFSKLQWDANLNVDDLLNEFFEKMFGSAKIEMKAYYELLERSWEKNSSHLVRNTYNYDNPDEQSIALGIEDMNNAFSIIEKALKKTSNADQIKRIEIIRDGLKYFSFFPLEFDLIGDIQSKKIVDKNSAEELEQSIAKLGLIIESRKEFWQKTMERNDLLGENVRGFQKNQRIDKHIELIESRLTSSVIRLLEWYRENDASELNSKSKVLLQALPLPSQKKLVKASSMTAVTSIQNNLLKGGEWNLKEKKMNNQNSKTGLNGWNMWSRMNLAKTALTKGYNNQGGIQIDASFDLKELAVVSQDVKNLKQGQTYLASVWVKINKIGDANKVNLSLRLQSNGKWYESNAINKASASSIREWQPIKVIITVPQGADGLSFQMTTNGASAEFSNPILYEVKE